MSNINLIVEPRKTYTWSEFKKAKTAYSVGLDGIISDTIRREPDNGPYANFDHHAKVDRMATRATCAQVYMEINMGLFTRFKKDGLPMMNIYVNDCDEDTCLAVWLLENHERVKNDSEPAIRQLVAYEDRLDCTAGAYPLDDSTMRRKMAWIFQPYHQARYEGLLFEMDADGMKSIVESVGARITQYALDGGKEIALEGQYEVIGGNGDWVMVKETGPFARAAMYNDGINAFVGYMGQVTKSPARHGFVFGRRSEWIDFPIPYIIAELNKREPKGIVTKSNEWGGGDTTGGSPRESGSSFGPKALEKQIKEILVGN